MFYRPYLAGLLALASCDTPPKSRATPTAPPAEPLTEARTWLGRVAQADLSRAAGMAVPLYARTQIALDGGRQAAEIEAGSPALPILWQYPAAAAWSPRAWRAIAALYAQSPIDGRTLAIQVAETMAGLDLLRQAVPGADRDRVAEGHWHRPAVAALLAARPRLSLNAQKWLDSLPLSGRAVADPVAGPIVRQADAAEHHRRQQVLLLAIAGIAPPEAVKEMAEPVSSEPASSVTEPPPAEAP